MKFASFLMIFICLITPIAEAEKHCGVDVNQDGLLSIRGLVSLLGLSQSPKPEEFDQLQRDAAKIDVGYLESMPDQEWRNSIDVFEGRNCSEIYGVDTKGVSKWSVLSSEAQEPDGDSTPVETLKGFQTKTVQDPLNPKR